MAFSKLSRGEENQIIKAYKSGLTADEIEYSLGFGRSSVYRCLKRNSIERRKKGHRAGCPAWNKGKKLSEEMKKKLNLKGLKLGRAWNKGKCGIYSARTKKKMSEAAKKRTREKASNWKGGRSRAYKTGYNSIQYKEWRRKVLKRDDFTCQLCGVRGQNAYLTAHHIKPFGKYPQLRYEPSNGLTVCELCHCKIDRYRAKFMKKEA